MKKKILITGITGMLGNSLYMLFKSLNNYEIYGVSRDSSAFLPEVKFINLDENKSETNFDILVHCAAEVNVDLCEKEKKIAYTSNVVLTRKIFSNFLAEKNFYISTDSIFDGFDSDYKEISITNPLNYYAETKLMGENEVMQTTKNFYIIRTNLYGFCVPMKNSLFEWAYIQLNQKKMLSGYENVYFNPMYIGQIASLIRLIIEKNIDFGIYNFGIDEKISKYNFIQNISKEFGFSNDLVIPSNFSQDSFKAIRPINTTLNNTKIKSIFPDFNFSFDSGLKMLKNDLLKNVYERY